MFGLVVFGLIALYLLIAVSVVTGAISHAKKQGKSVRRWGWGAALVMYLIPFWDWIPTVALHQYYCATESGFWTRKTFSQWKAENPGVTLTVDGISTTTTPVRNGITQIHQLNQRLNWVVTLHSTSSFLTVTRQDETLVDGRNNGELSRFVDFSRGDQSNTGTTKFWLVSRSCNGGETSMVRMGKLIDEIYADTKGRKE
jgi:hypothetical protein